MKVGMNAIEDWAPRKVTAETARMEQHRYWLGKTVAERLAAMTDLNRRMYRMRGIDVDEFKTDWTVSRVRRSKG